MQDGSAERGAALVEFAVVLPFLLMLVIGIIEFGRAYNTQLSLQSAAREGARALALGNSSTAVTARVGAATPVAVDQVTQVPCTTAGGSASVTVRESFEFGIPFVPLGARTLEATGVMRCGL